MNNLHEEITYSFMVAGHTKFSPDGFFGLFKLKLRKSEIENLNDLVQVVKESTNHGYNLAQTVFDQEGKRLVSFYACTEFLTNFFKPIPNFLKQHHFVFSKDKLGIVEIKEAVDGEKLLVDIRKTKEISNIIGCLHKTLPKELSIKR